MQKEARILDAPYAKNDFYVNIMDWGNNNTFAVALGSALYMWNPETNIVERLLEVEGNNDFPTSVAWSEDARSLAIGYDQSALQLWDVETTKCVSSYPFQECTNPFKFWIGVIQDAISVFVSLADSEPTGSHKQSRNHIMEGANGNIRKPRQINY